MMGAARGERREHEPDSERRAKISHGFNLSSAEGSEMTGLALDLALDERRTRIIHLSMSHRRVDKIKNFI
jgi:hypothetical protein